MSYIIKTPEPPFHVYMYLLLNPLSQHFLLFANYLENLQGVHPAEKIVFFVVTKYSSSAIAFAKIKMGYKAMGIITS